MLMLKDFYSIGKYSTDLVVIGLVSAVGAFAMPASAQLPPSDSPHTLVAEGDIKIEEGAQVLGDLTAPEVTILEPGRLVVAATPQIELAYDDPESGIDARSLIVAIDGAAISCLSEARRATCQSPALAEGEHLLEVEVRNGAGLPRRVDFPFQVVDSPDTVPPTLEILQPQSGASVPGADLEVVVTYSDDRAGIDSGSVRLELDGEALSAGCAVGESSTRCVFSYLDPGAHTLSAEVADLAGNMASSATTITVSQQEEDTEPPIIKVLAPKESTVYENPDFEIFFSHRDDISGIDVQTLVVRLDGVPITESCFVLPTRTSCDRQLSPGNHTIQLEVSDRAGNMGVASRPFEFRPRTDDDVPPSLEILTPEQGSEHAERIIEIELSFGDAESGIDEESFDVLLDGEVIPSCDRRNRGAADCLSPSLGDGAHLIEARVADRVGNEQTASLSFSVAAGDDTEGPIITIRSPVDPVVVGDSTPEIVIGFGDKGTGVDFDSIEIVLDGEDLEPRCLLDDVSFCDPEPLARGEHLLEVRAEDLAGNASSLELTIEIVAPANDTVPPSLSFSRPAEGATLVGEPRPRLRLDYADDARGAGLDYGSLKVEVDGEDITPFCHRGSTNADCRPPGLSDGAHTATASIRDLAGNAATASRTFVIQLEVPDEIDPELAITSPVGVVRGVAAPTATITSSDERSGIDVTSRRRILDGLELTAECIFGAGFFLFSSVFRRFQKRRRCGQKKRSKRM